MERAGEPKEGEENAMDDKSVKAWYEIDRSIEQTTSNISTIDTDP